MTSSTVSIILPVKNEGENIQLTMDSLFLTKTTYSFDVILVDDGSTDHCCDFVTTYRYKNKIKLLKTNGIGAANARNYGASHSTSRYFIFCDAHLQFEDFWIDQLIEPIKNRKTNVVTPAIADVANVHVVGYGQTLTERLKTRWNEKKESLFETAIVPGGCFAIAKEVFDDVGGFENKFKSWGHEDVEFSIKLWLFGYTCHVQPNVTILHLFRKTHPYKVPIKDVHYNFLTMAFLHFNEKRIEKCKQLLRYHATNKLVSQIIHDGVLLKRSTYFKKRRHDDDWYFNKFHITF